MLVKIEQKIILAPDTKIVGRPTVFTQTTVHKLEQALVLGCTVEEACNLSGVSRSAYYKRITEDPDFMDRMCYFQTLPILFARYTIIKSIRDGDIKTAMWYLERRRKTEFSKLATFVRCTHCQ